MVNGKWLKKCLNDFVLNILWVGVTGEWYLVFLFTIHHLSNLLPAR